jgi:hypothetical protein
MKDIPELDLNSDFLYLVCRVIRKGRIIADAKSKKKEDVQYRRPFGAAILNLGGIHSIKNLL